MEATPAPAAVDTAADVEQAADVAAANANSKECGVRKTS
jgi:hypothetical protein